MTLFPAFLKLQNRPVLIVGGGAIAASKIPSLLEAGAQVTIVSPTLNAALTQRAHNHELTWLPKLFSSDDLANKFLVIAATSLPEVNAAVFHAANQRQILCNAVDDIDHCHFYYGSIVQRGDLQIAISTNGKSPALAQRLRKELEQQFGPEYVDWLDHLGAIREFLRATTTDPEATKQQLHHLASREMFSRFMGHATHLPEFNKQKSCHPERSEGSAVSSSTAHPPPIKKSSFRAQSSMRGSLPLSLAQGAPLRSNPDHQSVILSEAKDLNCKVLSPTAPSLGVVRGQVPDTPVSHAGSWGPSETPDSRLQTDNSPRLFLIGAGPGDPDLLTRKAARLLQSAQIVLHDSLVSPQILALIPAAAQRIDVGKRAGFRLLTQQDINSLLIDAATKHDRVVRLKGGDPLLFGRAAEEIEALRAHNIPFEIVPGISAAFASAAAAQISLTDRRAASRVLFTTFSRSEDARSFSGVPIAPDTTVVVYMPGPDYAEVSRWLIDSGLSPETSALVISKASQPTQSSQSTTINALAMQTPLPAPALLIVGRVAAHSTTHAAAQNWFDQNSAPSHAKLSIS